MSNDTYLVKPVYKAFQVLQCVVEARRELSLTEIAHQVDLPKTTVFRYLHTLQECGLITHDPETNLYRLGLYAWEIGRLAGEQLRIRAVALPLMERLRDRYNETVNLGVLDGTQIVYLEMVESQRSLRMQAQLGSRDPAYSTALGKAILAFLPDDQWRAHLPARLSARTPRTITSLTQLRQDLEQTRQRGFAQDCEENEAGAWCVGAPVFDQYGRAIAALSVSAPATRLSEALAQEIAAHVKQTAAAVSQQLGFRSDVQRLQEDQQIVSDAIA